MVYEGDQLRKLDTYNFENSKLLSIEVPAGKMNDNVIFAPGIYDVIFKFKVRRDGIKDVSELRDRNITSFGDDSTTLEVELKSETVMMFMHFYFPFGITIKGFTKLVIKGKDNLDLVGDPSDLYDIVRENPDLRSTRLNRKADTGKTEFSKKINPAGSGTSISSFTKTDIDSELTDSPESQWYEVELESGKQTVKALSGNQAIILAQAEAIKKNMHYGIISLNRKST